jgi:hypothetical protein
MTPKKQVSPAIRILRGERDASARATHLEAATRKFLVTTNERKYMSTKTNFKRVAFVAVAALGLSLLSSVPSQATVEGTPVVTVVNGTAGVTGQASDSTTAATIAVRYFGTAASDTATITLTLGTKPATGSNYTTGSGANLRVTALDSDLATGETTLSPVIGEDSQIATTLPTITPTANSFGYGKFAVHLDSSTAGTRSAGTYTMNYVVRFYSIGTVSASDGVVTKTQSGTFDIVVTDGTSAAAAAVTAAGTSTAVLSDDGTPTVTGVDDVVSFPASSSDSPAGTIAAKIKLTQLTSASLPARESITVTTTIGNVGLNSGASRAKSATFQASANGIDTIDIYSDGSSGDAVITVKTTTVTFAAKAVNFYSTSVDKYVVTRLAKVIGSGSTTALVVTALDATGNVIKESSNSTVYAYSDNLAAIATATTAASGQSCSGYLAAYGGHYCSFSGSSNGVANITIRNKSTLALSTKSATAVAITVNLNPAVKVALSFDKATYAPGELAYLSVSAVDASGAAVGPNAGTNYLATGGITATAAFGNGSASADSFTATTLPMNVASTGRVTDVALYTLKVYMPASGGAISASATGGTALSAANQVKVTATATVTDNGAAALAAVTALATTVASLKTLITTLTNLVLKIQKKVKA